MSSGLQWWKLFENRNPPLNERAALMCESQHADAKLTAEDWRVRKSHCHVFLGGLDPG